MCISCAASTRDDPLPHTLILTLIIIFAVCRPAAARKLVDDGITTLEGTTYIYDV